MNGWDSYVSMFRSRITYSIFCLAEATSDLFTIFMANSFPVGLWRTIERLKMLKSLTHIHRGEPSPA